MKNKIYPCFWFNGDLMPIAEYYLSIFNDAKILKNNGIVVTLELMGNKLMLLNGGPLFKLTEAASLVVQCSDQAEIDHYWNVLSMEGEEGRCGWLKDKFGLSWQIVPEKMGEYMSDPDSAQRVAQAFMSMNKLIIADLEAAAQGT